MNRYLVFATLRYYPAGGWGDFVSSHATLEEAKSAADVAKKTNDYADVVDLEQMKEVYSAPTQPYEPYHSKR